MARNIEQHISLTAISDGRVIDRNSPEFISRREGGAKFTSVTYYTKRNLSQPYPGGGRHLSHALRGGTR